MARITVEDCLDNESNRFALVRLAARRAKQLLSGSHPVTDTKGNRAIVSALREIADGKVRFQASEIQPDTQEAKPPVAAPRVEVTAPEGQSPTLGHQEAGV